MNINKLAVLPKPQRLKNVAAYARVSSDKDAMRHSLSAQVSYFNAYIKSNKDWCYVGVYADEAISGTKDKRPQFEKLLDDCAQGKIDIIVTKSISRFARNSLTLLSVVRDLKQRGIAVIFQEQGINTLSSDGELMLTILASYAQEESLSVSENQKWRIRKCFKDGIPCAPTIYGYRFKKDKYVIEPAEEKIIKRIGIL